MSGVPDVSGPEAAFPPAPVPRNCRSPHSFMSRSFGLRGTGNPSPRNRQSPHSLISRSFRPPESFISSPGDRSHAASCRRSRTALFFPPDCPRRYPQPPADPRLRPSPHIHNGTPRRIGRASRFWWYTDAPLARQPDVRRTERRNIPAGPHSFRIYAPPNDVRSYSKTPSTLPRMVPRQ